MSKQNLEKYSVEEWEYICRRFFNSILNETEIAKLGQNVGVSWPFKGSDETPAKYIEYSLEELNSVPGLIGKKSRIHKLMDILRETLAFDDPFGDMADKVEMESEVDHTFGIILKRLNVAVDYPAQFVHFAPETQMLIQNEDLNTVLDVVQYGQTLTSDVKEGDDLKAFLNSLAHKDEVGIRKHIPWRRGDLGLYLPEAIGLAAKDLNKPLQYELLYQSGVELNEEESDTRQRGSDSFSEAQLKAALVEVAELCRWFSVEAQELKELFKSEEMPERFFIPINDTKVERVALALARVHFGISATSGTAGGGLLGKLSGLFGR
ncbi:MAG: hypothetical protein ACSHX8_09885 [Opitutaceae bacterium]